MYKYTAGQYFGPHYDDSVRDSVTGAKSEWTLLIYLSGAEDGVQGGEVPFNAFFHLDIVVQTSTLRLYSIETNEENPRK